MPVSLARVVDAEIIIKKSRFIGQILPMPDRVQALAYVQNLRTIHPEARHVCWALLAGGESGMSDDGEPSGTAGRPMMSVLQHKNLDHVLAVVVRYFGGVKLGAGGLTRAYTEAIASAMLNAEFITPIVWQAVTVALPFADENKLRHLLGSGNAYISAHYYTEAEAVFDLQLPAPEAADLLQQLEQTCRGQSRIIPPP